MLVSKMRVCHKPAMVLGVTIVGTMLIFFAVSCSKAPENPSWFQSTTTGETLDDQALINRIGKIDNIITLYRMRKEYSSGSGCSAPIAKALSERMDQLVSGIVSPGSPCPEVDLLAFDYRRPRPGRYRVDFLFRVNKPLSRDLKIGLRGVVSPKNRNQLSPRQHKAGKKWEKWSLKPSPPTSEWTPGEYVLITKAINGRPIPYDFLMFFSDPGKKKGEQLYGKAVFLGWYSGLSNEELLTRIASTDNLIDLYRVSGDTNNNQAIRQAFNKKAEELRGDDGPIGKICPAADLMAFNYRNIGDNRYGVDCLFRVTQPMEADCRITLIGVVDENHRELLSPKRKGKGKKSEKWAFLPFPQTEAWPAGKYILVSDIIDAQPIPYEMYIHLIDRKKRQAYGSSVYLGWQADPEEQSPEDR